MGLILILFAMHFRNGCLKGSSRPSAKRTVKANRNCHQGKSMQSVTLGEAEQRNSVFMYKHEAF